MDFAARLRRLSEDLRASCGVAVVWKDADPSRWSSLPRGLAQHRNAACVAVKRDGDRLARCIAADAIVESSWASGEGPRIRTCPFGVTEVLAPIHVGGAYQGCLFIGPWRRPGAIGAVAAHAQLPPYPGDRAALALARVATAAASEVAAHRAADLAAERARRRGDPVMARVVDWIDEHLAATLRVAGAARVAGLSPSRFVHRFKQAIGEPFGPYLRRRLMTEAARRLAVPGARVVDVSFALGFANQNWFATAFRRHHNCTPSAWRRRSALA